jgi:hypothetical protein
MAVAALQLNTQLTKLHALALKTGFEPVQQMRMQASLASVVFRLRCRSR